MSPHGVVSQSDVVRLVKQGAPHNDLVNAALVQANKVAVRDGGGIPVIVSLLKRDAGEPHPVRAVTAISALWSLAAHNVACQDAIRIAGGVPLLVLFLDCHNDAPEGLSLQGMPLEPFGRWRRTTCQPERCARGSGVERLIGLLDAAFAPSMANAAFPRPVPLAKPPAAAGRSQSRRGHPKTSPFKRRRCPTCARAACERQFSRSPAGRGCPCRPRLQYDS